MVGTQTEWVLPTGCLCVPILGLLCPSQFAPRRLSVKCLLGPRQAGSGSNSAVTSLRKPTLPLFLQRLRQVFIQIECGISTISKRPAHPPRLLDHPLARLVSTQIV